MELLLVLRLGREQKSHWCCHSIIESFRVEKIFKIVQSINSALTSPPLNPVPQCHIYTSKYVQGQWPHHCPGQLVPNLDYPNIQPETPLEQLGAVSSCQGTATVGHGRKLSFTDGVWKFVSDCLGWIPQTLPKEWTDKYPQRCWLPALL